MNSEIMYRLAYVATSPRLTGLRCVGEASSLCPFCEEARRGRFAYTALPAAHFERNDITTICETAH
jgi:hypothetical protein